MSIFIDTTSNLNRIVTQFWDKIKRDEFQIPSELLDLFIANNFNHVKKKFSELWEQDNQTLSNHQKKFVVKILNLIYITIPYDTYNYVDYLTKIIIPLLETPLKKYAEASLFLLIYRTTIYESQAYHWNRYQLDLILYKVPDIREQIYKIVNDKVIAEEEFELLDSEFFTFLQNNQNVIKIPHISLVELFQILFQSSFSEIARRKPSWIETINNRQEEVITNKFLFRMFCIVYVFGGDFNEEQHEIFRQILENLFKDISKVHDVRLFIETFTSDRKNHPFYLNSYELFFNYTRLLEQNHHFHLIGRLWKAFNLHSLLHYQTGDIINRPFFEDLLDYFKPLLSSQRSTEFNGIYMYYNGIINKSTNFNQPIFIPKENWNQYSETQITYERILQAIYRVGKSIQRGTSNIKNLDENSLRDIFVIALNQIYPITGESFINGHRSDILINNQKGEQVFNAECKIWSGDREMHAHLDQGLNYPNIHVPKACLIYFIKKQNFLLIKDRIEGKLENDFVSLNYQHLHRNGDLIKEYLGLEYTFFQKYNRGNSFPVDYTIMLFHFFQI